MKISTKKGEFPIIHREHKSTHDGLQAITLKLATCNHTEQRNNESKRKSQHHSRRRRTGVVVRKGM
jgi:hypothetical protein